jgi:hypothetical protein
MADSLPAPCRKNLCRSSALRPFQCAICETLRGSRRFENQMRVFHTIIHSGVEKPSDRLARAAHPVASSRD